MPASAAPDGNAREVVLAAPGEFEPQDYIWLSWRNEIFLGGGRPFAATALDVIKAITPHVKVRLLYSDETPPYTLDPAKAQRSTPEAAKSQILAELTQAGVDVSRVDLRYTPRVFGAIQDPGPFFLRDAGGKLRIADYAFQHPDPSVEAFDRAIAADLGLATVRSSLVSEGGARQSNGNGVLLLVKKVELDRNPGLALDEIEREHLRVHGAKKVIWLEEGPADEEWGRLPDGKWGVGTGGHVDVFARFADERTVLLAKVSRRQRKSFPILAETHDRMERNFEILKAARDQDGEPFRILRVPVPDPKIARAEYDKLSVDERYWFEGAAPRDIVEYYLPAGYLNFIIANDVIVTARLASDGQKSRRRIDKLAKSALEEAFPGRTIVQIDTTPLLHDGGGLHCHSRNQPFAEPQPIPAKWRAE